MSYSAVKQRVVSPDFSLISMVLLAEQCDSPDNVNWVVSSAAPVVMDDSNPALAVRAFNDTAEQGIGFTLMVPDYAVGLRLKITSRAKVAPSSTRNVVPRLYFRHIGHNVAVGSWSSGYDFTAISIPTNAYYQVVERNVSFGELGLQKGKLAQIEFTRKVSGVSNNLTGDWYLLALELSFV